MKCCLVVLLAEAKVYFLISSPPPERHAVAYLFVVRSNSQHPLDDM